MELNVNATIKVNKCKYKLVTDIGSFSTTEDVKEVCVNDAYDDYVFEYKREYHDVYGENTVSAMGVSFDGKPVYRVDLDIVSPSSYIRIYSDRNKTNLVKVYDNLYDYYHNRKYSVSYNNFYPATWEYYIELPEGEYYLDVSSDIENDYYSRVVYLEKLETVVIDGLWSDSEDVYNMIDDLRYSIWVGCPTLQSSFKNSFKGKQVNLDDEPTLTFTDLVDDTICYDKILVGFTNCDNYNDYKALKESGTMTCSGNVYHAVWANSDDYYSREK